MNLKLISVLIVIALALTFSAACTGTDSGSAQSTTEGTATAAATSATTTTPSADMVPGPTEQPAGKYQVDVQVNKNEVYGTITAIFRGGLGQNFVNSIVVDVYYPDGTHETKNLGTNVGDQVEFEGNQKLQDRVKVTATFDGNIGTYVIYDSLVPQKAAIPNP